MKECETANLSQTRLRVLTDNPLVLEMIEEITAGLILLDRDWRFAWISARAERHLRRGSDRLLGQKIWIAYPEIVGTELERQIREGRRMALTCDGQEPDPMFAARQRLQFLPLADGLAMVLQGERPTGAAITQNQPAQNGAPETPWKSRPHLVESISDATGHIIYLYDLRAGRFLYSNRRLVEILGYLPEELERQPPHEQSRLIHPDDRKARQESLDRLLKSPPETRVDLELRVRHQRGHWRWIACSEIIFERDAAGEPLSLLGTAQDITGKKQLATQLLRARQLESLGTLAEGIAHDLNNVLAPILMAIQLLKMKHPDADSERWLSIMRENIDRGAAMIRQILLFAQGSQNEQSTLCPGLLVSKVVRLLPQTLPPSLRIVPRIAPETWRVKGDADQLEQVLLNLVRNARDAMPGGGELTISVGNQLLDETTASDKPGARAGRYVVITVADDGEGITASHLPRVFEPFFTTRKQGHGTGLGLAIVQGIILGHDGFIDLWSEPGRGTVVQIYLPAITAPSTGAILSPGPGPAILPTILVIDHDRSTRDLTGELLENAGYQVLTADDGVDALAIYATRKNEIGTIVTAMQMPVMNGPATIRALFRLNPTARIIVCQAPGDEPLLDEATNAGARIFVPLPLTAAKLKKAMAPDADSSPDSF